jgi:cation:H+ antiporter
MEYFYLLIGLVVLLGSGHFLVIGSVELAKRLGISTLVIGVTVVSFGTSAPELIVSIKAALLNHPEISIGNVVGSNIANIALILGFTALISPIVVKRNSIIIDWPILMLSGILFYIFVLNESLQRYEGIVFIILISIYVYVIVKNSRNEIKNNVLIVVEHKIPLWKSLLFVSLATVGLLFGSNWLITGAEKIALSLGVSERIISITLIAFGTSLPELTTSIIAALKRESDISLGNIIGSNIFNTFGILGITSIVKDIPVVNAVFGIDILWMLAISVLLFLLLLPLKGSILSRLKGFILLLTYIIYITLLFF